MDNLTIRTTKGKNDEKWVRFAHNFFLGGASPTPPIDKPQAQVKPRGLSSNWTENRVKVFMEADCQSEQWVAANPINRPYFYESVKTCWKAYQ